MKYKVILQHSEEDCGAACLATIAKYFGRNFSLNHTREVVGTGQLGTTLLGLRRGAEAIGFNAKTVKADPELLDHLEEIPLPTIIHWKGNHWVVFFGRKRRKYIIGDPAIGIRYIERQELEKSWSNGVMLLLQKDDVRFYQREDDEIKGFGHFLRRVLPYRGILVQIIAMNLTIGILSLAYPFLIQILTDDVLVRGDQQLLVTVAIMVISMNIFSSLFSFVQSNLVANFAQRLQLGLVLEFCRQILRLPLNYYESRRSGEIVSRLRDINEINSLVSQVVIGLPSQFFIAVISFCLMIFYSGQLTIVAIILALAMSITTLIFLPTLQQKTRTLLVTAAENQGILVETFKGALTLKTTNAEMQAWEEFQTRFGRLANVTLNTIQISIINGVSSRIVSGIGSVALLWLGSSLVINRELTIGQLLAFNAMNANFTGFIATVIGFVDEFARAKTAMQRLGEVIDATAETSENDKKAWANIPDYADIICTNVNFHHQGRVTLLEDFTATIPGGKITALVGQSGCGKSTLAKLIGGLYQYQSGNIRYGVYNQQDLALPCLRQQVILVPQEPHFWSRSILENFRFSHPYATFEQIVQACQIAYADEFISELPDKYQTVLGEFGANISGGQRQRLALARAIINNPPILILDESTGALDPILENKVLDNLLNFRQGKTTILISHRPSVIMRADWIIVLDQGKIKIQEKPQNLINISGDHLSFLGASE